ncbi:MAG: hypothetical protein HC925_04185 [Coleofasciculaceae cyanobacterium SM2_3_26]|nr:hypothetical protein [Coleofasciculaceae cyanobacterium SM2_3_26]
MDLKKLFSGVLLAVGIGCIGISEATAGVLVTATLTADNHYGLFYGNEDGSELNFVGRNELGYYSDGAGTFNWSEPETWTFTIDPEDYLYVVVWDDRSLDEAWLGQFETSTEKTLLTNPDTWEYTVSLNPNPFIRQKSHKQFEGDVPGAAELYQEITNALWARPLSRGINDGTSTVWARWREEQNLQAVFENIAEEAHFLNTTTRVQQFYTIFRTQFEIPDVRRNPFDEPRYGVYPRTC